MAAETPREKEDEHQPARKVGSWNPRGERKKITADEHQPAWKVGSSNPWSWGESKITADEHQPARKVAVETPEEREKEDYSTAQRLTEQEIIRQSINDNLISKYHSILCKLFWYNM